MLKSILPLSFVVAARFFGLFIIMPVISLYAASLKHSTPILIGLLMGIYALTQIIFQLPFGSLSDKIGRKKTLILGLIIFIIGSLICAKTDDIYMMIVGRFLQGSGAIGAVTTALIADFTTEKNRSLAMAIMGGFIALAFASSMILSPLLSHSFGLASLFYTSIIMSFLCIFLIIFVVPPEPIIEHENSDTSIKEILKDKNILLLNYTNFMQKMLLGAAFLSMPIMLVQHFGYPKDELYKIYAFATFFGFLAMGFSGSLGERKNMAKRLLYLGALFFVLAYIFFIFSSQTKPYVVGIVLFFIGFNLHEPILQSCASKFVKANEKGKALGIFNSFGYLGSFFGSMIAGYALNHDFKMLSEVLVILALIWLFMLRFLKNPSDFQSLVIKDEKDFSKIQSIKGVFESYKNSEGIYIKYDSKILSKEELEARLA